MRPALCAKTSSVPTRISATRAVSTVAIASTTSAARIDQPSTSSSRRDVHRGVPPQVVPRDDDVDDEQRDRDRDRERDERVALGIAVPARDRRDEEEQRREPTSPIETKLDCRSISPRPPKSSEKPSTRSRFPITEPVSEPRTTSVRPSCTANSAMISSGALPNVALRKPPMPGPGVLGGVLGRLADEPGERDERGRGRGRTPTVSSRSSA